MKTTTVFRQLMLNIIIPLIVSVILFSCISYYYNKKDLEKYYTESKLRIVEEIKNLLSLYDFSMNIHEHEYSERMSSRSNFLVDTIQSGKLNPLNTDLKSLALKAEMDTANEFIYLIDTNCVIVNTTFAKDRGLDFSKLDGFFKGFFRQVRNGKKFQEDRFANEMSTGKIKKYTYQPTRDGKYIVELGFYSNRAEELKSLLNDKIGKISQSFTEIKNIRLIWAIYSETSIYVPQEEQAFFNGALTKKTSTRFTRDKDTIKEFTDFIYLDMMNSKMFKGYVIMINSSDIKERELVSNEIKKFGFIFLVTVIPLVLLVYFRARKITNPIKKLIAKVNIIRGGNLGERITIEGNNEITELSVNFNKMVGELQESYEGLEQKVRDRTIEISHQKELIEEKHKEITDSINYAERIQRTFLATNELLNKNLKDYFVFFKPKDIVSGDFYWGAILINGNFAFATADSTGHGVPGAIMSLLNIMSIEKAIENLTDPAEILNHTRKTIIERLKKDGSEKGGKDGMDCSLICFDLKNKQLQIAAANNPVWIIRSGEVMEIKPDKMPVGKHDRDNETFTAKIIDVKEGDVVYALTDGFPDQFGGEKGKKFMSKNLRELLTTNAHLPMQEQKQLLEDTFIKWTGDLEQVDDVTVVGIRI